MNLDTKHRLIKFRNRDKRWFHFKGSPDRFKALYERLRPLDAYITQSSFIDPLQLERGTGQVYLVNQSSLVFDFDNVSVENPKNLIRFMDLEFPSEKLLIIKETSRNHFQIHYSNPFKTENTGQERIRAFHQFNRDLWRELKERKIEVCDSTINPFQVVRIPFSTHRNGYKGRVLTRESLFKRIDPPGFPFENEKVFKEESPIRTSYKAIKDQVSKNRWVLYLEVRKVNKRLIEAQEKYKLGNLYVLDNNDKTLSIITLKTFDKRRLEKIRRFLGIDDEKTFRFIRTSQKIQEGKIISESPVFKEVIVSESKGQISREHLHFLRLKEGQNLGGNLGVVCDANSVGKEIPIVYEIKTQERKGE